MCDSLAPHFCSPYGDTAAVTPNLDRLAKQGVVFEKAYCNCPLSAPSRASILTGRYASQLEAFDNASEFSSEWPTIGHCLDAAGYEPVIIGKMHLVGHDQWHGFHDRVAIKTDYTHQYDSSNYQLAFSWEQPSSGNPCGHNWMGPSYVKDPMWDDFPLHYDRDVLIHKEALAYLSNIKQDGDKPFFACVSYHAPHNPFWAPQKDLAVFRGKPIPLPEQFNTDTCHGPMDIWLNNFHYVGEISDRFKTNEHMRWLYETFYAMNHNLDRQVGELLDMLDKQGLADNTAVVFISDHGDMMGQRGMIQKRYFYEHSVRVPMIASIPGGVKGKRITAPVSLVDLLPTFTDIAGAPLPDGLPGTSLAPCIESASEPEPRTLFCEYHGEGVHAPCFMAVRDNLKYIYVHNHEQRLYDVQSDPSELINIVDDPKHADTIAAMKRELLDQFDPEAIADTAIRSQRNRNFIHSCSQQKA